MAAVAARNSRASGVRLSQTPPKPITRNGVGGFSDWAGGNGAPLAAPLEVLQGTATPAGAVIAWETTSEFDALGYFVQRGRRDRRR